MSCSICKHVLQRLWNLRRFDEAGKIMFLSKDWQFVPHELSLSCLGPVLLRRTNSAMCLSGRILLCNSFQSDRQGLLSSVSGGLYCGSKDQGQSE